MSTPLDALPHGDLRPNASRREQGCRHLMTIRRFAAALAALTLLTAGSNAGAAEDDPAAARREVQRRKAAAAANIDVLRASDAEISAALADLEQNIRGQEGRAASARQAAAVAAAEVQRAEAAEARTDLKLRSLRQEMRSVAVEAYVNGPVQGLAIAVEATSFNDLANRRYLLEITAAKAADTTDRLKAAREDLALQRRRAAEAERRAQAQAQQVDAELVRLREAETSRAAVAKAVEVRLEQRLAEVTALAAVDAKLAKEITDRQLLIAEQLAARRPPPAPTTTLPTSTTSTSTTLRPPADRATTTTVAAPRAATSTSTTTTPKPSTSSRPSQPSLTTVRGITVATSIAEDLRALLEASDADGFTLSGGGYRNSDAQIEARRANCGTSDYDIYDKPASECDPPTARPGQSMHEQGLAIDFTSDGRLIQSRSDPAFVWLARNAARFGLYNLPREPWHWSTNGN